MPDTQSEGKFINVQYNEAIEQMNLFDAIGPTFQLKKSLLIIKIQVLMKPVTYV